MRDLMRKELKLSASVLTFLFTAFGLMFFLPGYPILCGAFFVTLGIFQSFQNARETNDILFSALLPVAKRDIVRAKFLFVCLMEGCGLLLMGIAVLVRMTVLSEAAVYRSNALMNANCFALGLAFLIFGLFNALFVGGFFKTAYQFARPFAIYTAAAFFTVILGETLHHIPGMAFLNAFGTDELTIQLLLLAAGISAWCVLTLISCRLSCTRFEKIDL